MARKDREKLSDEIKSFLFTTGQVFMIHQSIFIFRKTARIKKYIYDKIRSFIYSTKYR